MAESVKAVLAAHPTLVPGDAFVTNDPAAGGSHLPDVTVVSPVHDERGVLRFVCASRGHHADIGGITPGSMPPNSTTLSEEGVVLSCLRIVHDQVLAREDLMARLMAGPHPARNPAENLADLEAKIAANQAGARLLADHFGYYETIAGGAGATPRAPGASAVHTHMTNTRITDPEVLERRFPVRLLTHAIRRGSGGQGARPGGDGVVRELEALAPLMVNILSERRVLAPFGLQGGQSGARGRNLINGVEIPGRAQLHVEPGTVIRIETPGGGAHGP